MRPSAWIAALAAAMTCLVTTGIPADALAVARAGDEYVTTQDVAMRSRLNAAQPGMGEGVGIALFQLVKSACLRDVAERIDRPLTDADLEREVERIDANTRMPDQLAALKKLCADDAEYARVFVLPDFSERWLRTQYPWCPGLHADQGRRAESILAAALAGKAKWTALARREGLECRKVLVSRDEGIRPLVNEERPSGKDSGGNVIDASKVQPPVGVLAAAQAQMDARQQGIVDELIEKVLAPLQPGAVHGHVIEMQDEFLVLRLLAAADGEYTAEAISVPKVPYDTWAAERIAETPLEILDRSTWDAMLKNVPVAAGLFACAAASKDSGGDTRTGDKP